MKVIKDRKKWRPYPMRRDGDPEEGGDMFTMEKIREFAQEGYAPFFLKKKRGSFTPGSHWIDGIALLILLVRIYRGPI
ncbi:MAG: hypothetical protein ACKPKO_21340 [Candidatus Fonsibacter sp.]